MNKNDFSVDANVVCFIDWLTKTLPTLPVNLCIASSRFVPGGIKANLVGINNVVSSYQWKSIGTTFGSWSETKTRLDALAIELRKAVSAKDEARSLAACEAILEWGGNRNKSVGAYPFLIKMANAQPSALCDYISTVGSAFELRTADTGVLAKKVKLMNSMLTKVHALYANDGLPIYDSRVAAAIASLVELWRVSKGITAQAIPTALLFPATLRTRTVLQLFPNAAHNPGVMSYGLSNTPADWSSAKIRLGWLMGEVLNRDTGLFQSEKDFKDRMHAFEASLFMIGYDVACLAGQNRTVKPDVYKKKAKKRHSALTLGVHQKTIKPLSGQGESILYDGDITNGFSVVWGKTQFTISPEDIAEIDMEFGGCKNVPLGASMTCPTPNSLGQWLVDNGWTSARYASAIAAVFRHEGLIIAQHGSKPILLEFA